MLVKVSHLPRCVALGAAFVSNAIYAQEIGASLDCHLGPHTFIEQLVDEKEIDPVPMKVSANSVNAYRLRPNQNLTALGFKVRAVFGFSPNDAMFTQKISEGETPHRVYGVVVMAGKEAVSERIRETGSPATVREVMPLVMTAVVCDK
ncbi:hypothetical protein AB3X91_10090 [Paraburkholderia sp. BR14263]